MKDTNTKGSVTEARVLASLTAGGYTVSIPFGVAKYDLVVDMDGQLKKVQCKTGRLRKSGVQFNAYSVGRDGASVPYPDCDFFGVYCPDTDEVYIVPVDIVGHTKVTLRVDPIRSAREYKTNWARDFRL